MEKLNTIQKRDKLNEVFREGDVGPGGAYHHYSVDLNRNGTPIGRDHIKFQTGPRNVEGSTHGVLDVDLLEIVRDRLMCFQSGDYACRENAIALTHIEEALLWLNKRVEDRAERGVLGTEEK